MAMSWWRGIIRSRVDKPRRTIRARRNGLSLGRLSLEALEDRTLPAIFLSPVSSVIGAAPVAVAVADLNGDGKLDAVTANADSNTISVAINNGGTFATPMTLAAGNGPSAVAVADFNGDGRPDLVVANSSAASVSVLMGNGDGTFGAGKDFPVGSSSITVAMPGFSGSVANPPLNFGGATPAAVAVGDFNG